MKKKPTIEKPKQESAPAEQIEEVRQEHLHFLEVLERVDASIRRSTDLQQVLDDVIATVLSIFESDHAFLVYPCDPNATSFTVPVMHTRPEYPGVQRPDEELPMDEQIRDYSTRVLATSGPVVFREEESRTAPGTVARDFGIRSRMVLAAHPKIGYPWLFGVHQCSHDREWTVQEKRIFKEIGHRIEDALNVLLLLRNLRTSEEQYRLIAENMTDLIAMSDEEGNFAYVSPSYRTVLGYEPDSLLGKPIYELVHGDDLEGIVGLIEERKIDYQPAAARYRMRHRSGQYRWFETHGRVVFDDKGKNKGAVFNTRDITENRRLETELRQAQKMEAIGTLAGGIAHDFNNILGIIMGHSELALHDIPESYAALRNLKEVRKACLRAKDMVGQILAFSRQTEQERKPVRVLPIVEESLRFLRTSIPTTIQIREDLSSARDTILADPTQINQILINLFSNAAHAMRDKGGVIEISVRNARNDRNVQRMDPDLAHKECLLLAVRDTGHGMTPALMDRIFDPYFTTKDQGQGTGMGLSVVHGIVRSHGGTIRVESEPEKGTLFEIAFPLVDEEAAPEETSRPVLPTGTERILFVDDEEALADATRQMLEHLGYEVTAKTSSREALQAFRDQPDRFDLVITDMTMPSMTGGELSEELMRIRPALPIILCTGFSEMITEEEAKRMGIRAYVMKPASIHEIAQTVRRVLDPVEQE